MYDHRLLAATLACGQRLSSIIEREMGERDAHTQVRERTHTHWEVVETARLQAYSRMPALIPATVVLGFLVVVLFFIFCLMRLYDRLLTFRSGLAGYIVCAEANAGWVGWWVEHNSAAFARERMVMVQATREVMAATSYYYYRAGFQERSCLPCPLCGPVSDITLRLATSIRGRRCMNVQASFVNFLYGKQV